MNRNNFNPNYKESQNVRKIIVSGIAWLLCLSTLSLWAQENKDNNTDNGGNGRRNRAANFDPAQFQQRMLDSVKERLGFTNDTEWAAVQPLVQKVMDARRDTMGGMGFGRIGSRPPGSGESTENRRNAFFTPNPDAEALQKAIDDKVPAAQVKDALEKYRTSRKDKTEKLATAQEDLRKVLTVRQEAQAALLGLVP